MNRFGNDSVILNITDRYQAVDMVYARKNHLCVKHANHLLAEYAPEETGKILAGMVFQQA